MAQVLIALPDPQLGLRGQRVLRKILQEAAQGGDAQRQLLLVAGSRQLVRLGHPEGGLGQQVGRGSLVQIQQVLPSLPGLGWCLVGQQGFAQPKAGLDHQRVIDVLAEELAVQFRGLGEFVQLLLALRDQQFQSHAALQLRPDARHGRRNRVPLRSRAFGLLWAA